MPSRDAFADVVDAFRKHKDVRLEPGWGANNSVLKTAGKIFAMSVKGELVAKLPRARVDELVHAKRGRRFDPRKNGRVMKEWVVIQPGTLPWIPTSKEAYRFVAAVIPTSDPGRPAHAAGKSSGISPHRRP